MITYILTGWYIEAKHWYESHFFTLTMLYIQVCFKGVVGHAIPTWGLPVGHYLHSYKEVHQLEVTFCAPAGLMADRLAKYFVPMFGRTTSLSLQSARHKLCQCANHFTYTSSLLYLQINSKLLRRVHWFAAIRFWCGFMNFCCIFK